ncbi:MogA/MoaB family molybdenum cofactor biosynthesis protein [Alkalicoccus urumqiensis]|uniref:Molybdenum cofactor biosynthesis protein B n=1 Tax=Alkalicoccus urumqiensis TaxID=1548213 RepID=A0A2P6MIF0_ALKUR|nr:molybdenum cofactor biosynthesis protein B [Alkalicoccus urumqiensis]PRO66066.1 molybdenum cofactor biosynthesis protein [Alkalicoccus urumqiensis]
MSVEAHKQEAPSQVTAAVITVSDTRTKETDKSGQLIETLLEENGHQVESRTVVTDEKASIENAVLSTCGTQDVVILNGGTGIAARDVTIETVVPLFTKEIPGFGEIFRMLSYTEDIGSAAVLSRAAAGVVNGTVVFSLPGSRGAVRLGMTKLILPEAAHMVREVRKDRS